MKEFNIKFTVKLSKEVVLFIRCTTYDKRKKIKHKLIPCHSFDTNSYFCKGIYSHIYYHLYRDDYIESNIIRRD